MIGFSRKFYHRCVSGRGSLRWILEVILIGLGGCLRSPITVVLICLIRLLQRFT